MGKYDRLFEPIQVGPVTVPNRIYQPPHCCGYGESERSAYFRGEKAKGGFGLLITESASVHPTSDNHPFKQLDISRLSVLPNHQIITDRVHQYGAKMFCQLWHGGLQTAALNNAHGTKNPGWGPSPLQDAHHLAQCKEMEEEDIQEVLDGFGKSAVYAKLAGYDGVQIHAGHSYLVYQFLSTYYNKRTDRWGGSLENRARFFREALRRVREAIGTEIAVAARLTVDDCLPFPGFKPDEAVQVMIMLNDMVDFWDIDWGIYPTAGDMIGPARRHPENYQVPSLADVRKRLYDAVSKHTPVGGCGRIRTPDDALRMIEEGQLDMVGMVRQSIADPHWPRKVQEENLDEIRECIACNGCVAAWQTARPLLCTSNATAGEEYRGILPEEFDQAREEKMVLVLGGGVTGMEVAHVAAARGHTVHLHEERSDVGGHTSLLAKLPGCEEWNRLVDWRKYMLGKRGVNLSADSSMDAKAILEYGADVIVFATGAVWDRQGVNPITKEPIPGWEKPHVLVPEDILREGKKVNGSVLILDSDSYLMAVGLAEMLADQGNEVTLVSYPVVGQYLFATLELTTVKENLYRKNVNMIPDHFAFEITDDGALLANTFTGTPQDLKCDHVIFVTRRVPQMQLYKEVKANASNAEFPFEVHLTGEAISPKSYYSMPRALYWAHALGREI